MNTNNFEVEYDNDIHYYQYKCLPVRQSAKHSIVLMKTIFPIMGSLDSEINDLSGLMSSIDPDVLYDLMEAFLKNTRWLDQSQDKYLLYSIENHFCGKTFLMYKVFIECLKIEYKDFFLMIPKDSAFPSGLKDALSATTEKK